MKFLIACWLVLLLGLWPAGAASPGSGHTDPGSGRDEPISLADLIPGLSQLRQKKPWKGTLLLAGFTGCMAGAIFRNERGGQRYRQYLDSTDVEEIIRLREESELAFRQRNLFLLGGFAVWVLHLVDITFFHQKVKIESEIKQDSLVVGIGLYL